MLSITKREYFLGNVLSCELLQSRTFRANPPARRGEEAEEERAAAPRAAPLAAAVTTLDDGFRATTINLEDTKKFS